MKEINYYKGQAFKTFTELNNWKFKGLTEMLSVSVINYSLNMNSLNKWHNLSIQLYKDSYELFNALESQLSFRAYHRASQLLDMWELKVNQVVNYKESLK